MSARNDAIDAAVKATTALRAASLAATGWPASQREVALTAVDAAIPVLLAPLRAVIDRALADVDAGRCINAVSALISTDVILREIEDGESR